MPKFRLGDKVEFTSEGGYIWRPYSYKDYYGILVKKLSLDSSVWTVQVIPRNPQDFRFPLGPYTKWTFHRMYLEKYQPTKEKGDNQMTTRQSRSKQALEIRKTLARRISTLVKIEKTLRELPETVGVSIYAYETSIYVKGMGEFHDVRRVLKHLNLNYEDQLDSIYPSWDGLKGCAKYKTNLGSPEYRVYVIMEAPIEGFPIKTGDNCGFKEVEIPAVPSKKTIVYSCDSSKGE